MQKIILAATAATLLAGTASSQSKYMSPSMFAKKAGNYQWHSFPFTVSSASASRVTRYQEIHNLPATAKGKLSAIAMRTSSYHTNFGAPPKFWTVIELKISTANNQADKMSSTFASNIGKDVTTVIAKKKISFGSFPILPKDPQPLFYKLPFDKNKVLAFAGNKSLLLDFVQSDNDLYDSVKRVWRRFYPDAAAYQLTSSTITHEGRACYPSKSRAFLPFYQSNSAWLNRITNKIRFNGNVFNGNPGSIALQITTSGALSAPIPLGGGCSLYIDPSKVLWAFPTVLDTRGFGFFPNVGGKRVNFEIPWQTSFNGTNLIIQSFNVDAGVNKPGFATSQKTTLTMPFFMSTGYPVSSVYRTRYTGTATGFARKGYGHVTEFTFN